MKEGLFRSYDEVLDHKRVVLERLREKVRTADTAVPDHPRPDGGWSVRRTLEHLVIVGEAILAVANKLVERARAAGTAPAPLTVDTTERFRQYRSRKIKTRPPFEPAGGLDPAASLERLAAVTRAMELLAPRLAAVDPSTVTFRHWELGPLTLAEWLVLVGVHEERHLEQPPFV